MWKISVLHRYRRAQVPPEFLQNLLTDEQLSKDYYFVEITKDK